MSMWLDKMIAECVFLIYNFYVILM